MPLYLQCHIGFWRGVWNNSRNFNGYLSGGCNVPGRWLRAVLWLVASDPLVVLLWKSRGECSRTGPQAGITRIHDIDKCNRWIINGNLNHDIRSGKIHHLGHVWSNIWAYCQQCTAIRGAKWICDAVLFSHQLVTYFALIVLGVPPWHWQLTQSHPVS